MNNSAIRSVRAKATGVGSTIILVLIALVFGCSTDDQGQVSQTNSEATPHAARKTEAAVSSSESYAEPDCPEMQASILLPSIDLVDGSLAIEDLCPLSYLYDMVSEMQPVVVRLEYPSSVTDILRAAGNRESGPEVEFARFWEQHRSETEVGLVRLAAMLSATPPRTGGNIDDYSQRMMTILRQGTVSTVVAARLRSIASVDSLVILDVDSGSMIDKQDYLESLDHMAENSEVNSVTASLALRHHLGEGRNGSAVSSGLGIRALENYLLLRSDRLFSAMYGNLRIEDVSAMGEDWEAFIDGAIRREFEDSVRKVDSGVPADALWFECGGEALPGAPYNYGRFLFPRQRLDEVWREKMRFGPWPVGPATEVFAPSAWARFASWQMLARESGYFADIMSLYREDMNRCGPP